jgi:hypothetical protein
MGTISTVLSILSVLIALGGYIFDWSKGFKMGHSFMNGTAILAFSVWLISLVFCILGQVL